VFSRDPMPERGAYGSDRGRDRRWGHRAPTTPGRWTSSSWDGFRRGGHPTRLDNHTRDVGRAGSGGGLRRVSAASDVVLECGAIDARPRHRGGRMATRAEISRRYRSIDCARAQRPPPTGEGTTRVCCEGQAGPWPACPCVLVQKRIVPPKATVRPLTVLVITRFAVPSAYWTIGSSVMLITSSVSLNRGVRLT
jgi:hypothetical protein